MVLSGGISGSRDHPRLLRRAEPRLLITMAAAGAVLAIIGPLQIAGNESAAIDPSGSSVPGILLTAALVGLGYTLLHVFRDGPMATAGSIAAVGGIPSLMFFLTMDTSRGLSYSAEGILLVSCAAYLVTWYAGAGRTRPVFLGMGLLAAWMFVVQVVEEVFDAGLLFFPVVVAVDPLDPGSPTLPGQPDLTTIGVISLAFGVTYMVVARSWDLGGWRGAATPATAIGLVALVASVSLLAEDLRADGTGLLLLMIGLPICLHGSRTGRRATTWLGGFAMAFGVALIIADATDDLTIAGLILMVVGVGVILAAYRLEAVLHEPDEVSEPSERLRRRSDPRMLITVSASGGVLVAAGATAVGLDMLLSDGGDGSQFAGIGATGVVIAVGYYVMARVGQGPRATGGSVAAAVAIPFLVFFVTYDLDSRPIFSVEVVLAVSSIAWLGTWFWTKRPVLLGAGLFGAWLLLLELAEEPLGFIFSGDLFSILFVFFGDVPDVNVPDPTILGFLSVAAGAGYVVLATAWDRRGDAGAATPVLPAAIAALWASVLFLSGDLEQIGSGLMLVVIGCVLGAIGASALRRFTTWSGGAAVVVGMEVIIGDVASDGTSGGILSALVGVAIVLAAHGLGSSLPEPDEMQPRRRLSTPPLTVAEGSQL